MQLPYRKKEDDRRALAVQDFHVTPEKLEQMKHTLVQLKKDRPSLVIELSTAREMGDLSENAAYSIAKSNLRKLDGRVLSLEDRIKNAIVIQKPTDSTIGIGSKVILEGNVGRLTYELVGPVETDPAKGRISFQSPLGSLLLNKKVGDEIVLNGREIGKIVEVG